MIIGEVFVPGSSNYLGFNMQFDNFGGKGKARRQEKKQFRQVKRSVKKVGRIEGRLVKANTKKQFRIAPPVMQRRSAPIPPPAQAEEQFPEEQMAQAGPGPETEPASPQPMEEGAEPAPSSNEDASADAYLTYVPENKAGIPDADKKKTEGKPLVGMLCMGAMLFVAGYVLHKVMSNGSAKEALKGNFHKPYGYTRTTH